MTSTIADIDARIAIPGESLRELIEQVAAFPGAAHEQLILQRIRCDRAPQVDRHENNVSSWIASFMPNKTSLPAE